ncbi:uncharacterized protein LOC129584344 [Paramacrobiotus metropolitanus]|uniref:uncharacterized protein LOC129584344 n=1 Tax=Paramacrobiotus metropolitanus TaxID=2943436 RepID=UPI002445943F|nr:uncharacterized protein LOC129584344 [Paramacrobiotus metropolitanus]
MRRWHTRFVCVGILLASIYHTTNAAGSTTNITSPGNSTGSGQCLPIPNVIPRTNATYNLKHLVDTQWFGYLAYNTDNRTHHNASEWNAEHYYYMQGGYTVDPIDPKQPKPATVIYIEKVKYATNNRNSSCSFVLEVAHFTNDLQQFGPYVEYTDKKEFVRDGYDRSVVWSVDYKTYIIFFWCARHNRTSGNCASTHIYVYTRIRPYQLNKSEKDSIDKAVNSVLKPYCLDVGKFAKYNWDNRLYSCSLGTYPDTFKHYMAAYRTVLNDIFTIGWD